MLDFVGVAGPDAAADLQAHPSSPRPQTTPPSFPPCLTFKFLHRLSESGGGSGGCALPGSPWPHASTRPHARPNSLHLLPHPL
jgi:hypothetical protein